MVGAVGGVQERLGAGGDVAAVQEELADGAAEPGAAGLAGQDVVDVGRREQVGEDADLGGLADAVAALEGDEQARLHGVRRLGSVGGGLRLKGVVDHRASVAGGADARGWAGRGRAEAQPSPPLRRDTPCSPGFRPGCCSVKISSWKDLTGK